MKMKMKMKISMKKSHPTLKRMFKQKQNGTKQNGAIKYKQFKLITLINLQVLRKLFLPDKTSNIFLNLCLTIRFGIIFVNKQIFMQNSECYSIPIRNGNLSQLQSSKLGLGVFLQWV